MAERGGLTDTDLSPSRAHMKGTGPSSRPPCRWLRRDSRPEPRALHGATVQKSVTGDQHGSLQKQFLSTIETVKNLLLQTSYDSLLPYLQAHRIELLRRDPKLDDDTMTRKLNDGTRTRKRDDGTRTRKLDAHARRKPARRRAIATTVPPRASSTRQQDAQTTAPRCTAGTWTTRQRKGAALT